MFQSCLLAQLIPARIGVRHVTGGAFPVLTAVQYAAGECPWRAARKASVRHTIRSMQGSSQLGAPLITGTLDASPKSWHVTKWVASNYLCLT